MSFHFTNILGHSFAPCQTVSCSSKPCPRHLLKPLPWMGHRKVDCRGLPVNWRPPSPPLPSPPCSLNKGRASSFVAHDAQRKEMRPGDGGSFLMRTHMKCASENLLTRLSGFPRALAAGELKTSPREVIFLKVRQGLEYSPSTYVSAPTPLVYL